jgi:hypothetical protein
VGSSAAMCVVQQHVTDCVREMDGARDFLSGLRGTSLTDCAVRNETGRERALNDRCLRERTECKGW